MAERAGGAVKVDRTETGCNFPDALRRVQGGARVRRDGWNSAMLYISQNAKLDRVELVREGCDDQGPFHYSVAYLGGGAFGGPSIDDLLAEDWQVVTDPRVPTEEGGERAMAAELAEIDAEGDDAGLAPGAAGCGAGR